MRALLLLWIYVCGLATGYVVARAVAALRAARAEQAARQMQALLAALHAGPLQQQPGPQPPTPPGRESRHIH